MNIELMATLIFGLAILHTLFTPTFFKLSQNLADGKKHQPRYFKLFHFLSELFHLLGEVEVVFGLWLIPLILLLTWGQGWQPTAAYLNSRDYSYALYITVIVVVIGSRPIISFAQRLLEWIARLGGDSPGAWWLTILIVGPLLGALIKEPAAMALSAILLTRKFYPYPMSVPFRYATLGLLFANISVGGMLTPFASRALFIVADQQGWGWGYMMTHFGWKAALGILLSTALYYFLFRKGFSAFPAKLPALEKQELERPTPLWITVINLCFMAGIILTSGTPAIFMGIFVLFLGFWTATSFYQSALHLKPAILVGFFFASLLIHGELQEWWIVPFIRGLSNGAAMLASYGLSAIMDNAMVTYLTVDLVDKQYFVITGALSAGALTIVANVPNPIGHSILRDSFVQRTISFFGLFVGALTPSLIYLALFWFFR